ncbi:MAG: threonine aldolase family protein [Gemmatimonadaceae bacterium]
MPIDLRSDTVTKPTPGMRQAMASAEVGDDVLDGDPSTQKLEARVAGLLGKERAMFFPTGSMANQAAVWLHTTPGTEILLDAGAHIINYEMGAAAALAGAQVRPVTPASALTMTADDLLTALRPASRFAPAPSLVALENTHNGAGGKITPIAEMRRLAAVARERGLPVHLDGARLWNAAVASGTALAEFADCADTVMVSFAKGLGAPVGAALAGPAAVMDRLWDIRKRLGGGMRQSGILAAGVLYALEHQYDRLAEDHATARRLGQLVDGVAGARVVPPDTNIVMVDLPAGITAAQVAQAAAEEDVLVSPWSATRIRMVVHLDAPAPACERAGELLGGILARLAA